MRDRRGLAAALVPSYRLHAVRSARETGATRSRALPTQAPLVRTSIAPGANRIAVDGFEGPLELLLHLLDQRSLDITVVSLVAVTEQYLGWVRALPSGPAALDALAEFLVVATHLLLLKSRALLPRQEAAPRDDDVVDAETLEQRLIEYRRYRAAAMRLHERHQSGVRAFARLAPAPPPPAEPPRLERADPGDLARALLRLLAARAPAETPPAPPRTTLAGRIDEVR